MGDADRLQALGNKITECLSQINPGVPIPGVVMVVGSELQAELHPTLYGVEYVIRISVMDAGAKAKAAKARLDKLRRDPAWIDKALEKGTSENIELADLQRIIALGRVARR